MSTMRSLKRQIQKSNGKLTHKKVLARKFGCTLKEVNAKLENRKRNLKELGMMEDK